MGRYRKLGELHPSDITFAIFSDIMKDPRIIDYGMYLNPVLEVYFTICSTLWGRKPENLTV